jgi:hypothetical protein
MSQKLPIRVEFQGATLEGAIVNGRAYVAMKPIVEGLGLDWTRQLQKLKADPVLGPEVYNIRGIPSAGGAQTMVCLPEERLQGWLFKINPNKVKASVREKVIAYQREAYRVLHQAFSKGVADTNMRVMAIDSKRAAGRLMTDMKADVLRLAGKDAKPYEFSNEHRLVNWALTDEFGPLDESALTVQQLRLLADLRRRNTVLLVRGADYQDRKKMLKQHVQDWRAAQALVMETAA